MPKALLLFLSLVVAGPAAAQSFIGLPPHTVDVATMEDFRPTADNWQVAGSLVCDPQTDGALDTQPGTGLLVNTPTEQAQDHLFTAWEHGDIELELDFLVPKGSNSGVYLQGRYEVQIFDSWGVDPPAHSDAGGIYQRWDPSRGDGQEGYEGHPPRLNVSRAPCLWQHYRIVFRAPRFDAEGNKVENARFVEVWHNGVRVHEDVEITGPTRAAPFDDEQTTGPLMIQGDHGPVALRNIRYKRSSDDRVRLSDLTYEYIQGDFETFDEIPFSDASALEPIAALDGDLEEANQEYALAFEGTLTAPRDGAYRLDLGLDWVDGDPHLLNNTGGGAILTIDGDTVIVHKAQVPMHSGDIELTEGPHPFRLAYFKSIGWNAKTIQLFAEGPSIPQHALHRVVEREPVAPIHVAAETEPEILRSFVMQGDDKITHAISVGDPARLHYAYDAEQGALLKVWKGNFVETTPMWHSRGLQQIAIPRGSLIDLARAPGVATLATTNTAWPDSAVADYRFLGYDLDDLGRPTFRYRLGETEVQDHLHPGEDGKTLIRTVTAQHLPDRQRLWHRAAAANRVTRQPDGRYLVGDRLYFIELSNGVEPFIRRVGDTEELLLPLQEGTPLSYTMIW